MSNVIKDKKSLYLTIIGMVTILLTIIGATYAFFQSQGGEPVSVNTSLTSETTDLLTFQIDQDISFRVKQSDLASGSGKLDDPFILQ